MRAVGRVMDAVLDRGRATGAVLAVPTATTTATTTDPARYAYSAPKRLAMKSANEICSLRTNP
jgi:hypothetical protein